ncbi:MAG: M90 family metallopeptidase [Noviherbaspirillum sp.]
MELIRRLFRRAPPQIPDRLWDEALHGMPFLDRLQQEERVRLRELTSRFLGEHAISGAGDFIVTDDIALCIAIQACLPVLNLTLSLYSDIAGVIVYPSAFIVRHSEMDEAGVIHEWEAPMAGEALDAGGAVVLSWEDAEQDHAWDDGGNLVIHEFVHKIDMGSGGANGCPPFLAEFHQGISPQQWTAVFSSAYADFCTRVEALERRLPEHFDEDDDSHAELYAALAQALPMDPYGAENPAEFFAVASEAFFALPAPLAAAYPQVVDLLEKYYRQKAVR